MSRRQKLNKSVVPGARWIVASTLFLCLIFLVFSWYMGYMHLLSHKVVDSFALFQKREKITLESILVQGREQADRSSILASINVPIGTPMMSIDLQDVHLRLEQNPWVKMARVERHFPHTLKISIKESAPIGRWQRNQEVVLLSDKGLAIPVSPQKHYDVLPLFVGVGANKEARALLALLKDYPTIKTGFSSAIWVGDRRWNLILHNGWTVRLPQKDKIKALQELEKTLNNKNIVKQNIEVLDLRIPGRMTLTYKNKRKKRNR